MRRRRDSRDAGGRPSAARARRGRGSDLRPHARGGLGEVFVAMRRGAEPRGRPQGDPGRGTPTTPRAARGSCSRPRSPAGWSTRGSSRSTAWATTRDGRPFYAMRFIRGDSLKEAIDGSTRPTAARRATRRSGRWRCGSCSAGSSTSATRSPTPTAAACCTATSSRQHHAGPVRRDAGRRLGPGQGVGPAEGDGAGRDGSGRSRPSSAQRRDADETAPGRSGHAGVHEPRAGRGRARPARAGQRRLQPGGDALLPADRPAAVRRTRTSRSVLAQGACGAISRRPRRPARTSRPALEAVCLKAMARGPRTGTPSPAPLADDIERWLADEPVSALREPWAGGPALGAAAPQPVTGAAAALDRRPGGPGRLPGLEAQSNRRLLVANDREKRAREQAQARFRLARDAVAGYYRGVSEDVLLEAHRVPRPPPLSAGVGDRLLSEDSRRSSRSTRNRAGRPPRPGPRRDLALARITGDIASSADAVDVRRAGTSPVRAAGRRAARRPRPPPRAGRRP